MLRYESRGVRGCILPHHTQCCKEESQNCRHKLLKIVRKCQELLVQPLIMFYYNLHFQLRFIFCFSVNFDPLHNETPPVWKEVMFLILCKDQLGQGLHTFCTLLSPMWPLTVAELGHRPQWEMVTKPTVKQIGSKSWKHDNHLDKRCKSYNYQSWSCSRTVWTHCKV